MSSNSYYRLRFSKIILASFIACAFCLPTIVPAETWHEDFTDGSFNDNAEMGFGFLSDHELRADGLVISSSSSCCPAAVLAKGLGKSENWSIRSQGRLLQDHGFFGAAISPTSTASESLWSLIGSSGTVQIGSLAPGNATPDQTEFAMLDPTVEDVVFQLDVFDETVRLWAWSASDPPVTEIDPFIEADFGVTNGYASMWVRSNDGPSEVILRNMTVSTEHIPIATTPGIDGDFNGNGALDVDDINLLTEASAAIPDMEFDLNDDGAVNVDDVTTWIKDLGNSWIGDSNFDGEFNSTDFVTVFRDGKYEQDSSANWSQGDWNGDGRFNSGDLVAAFQDGGFEQGPRVGALTVPEPNSMNSLALLVMLGIWFRGRVFTHVTSGLCVCLWRKVISLRRNESC